MYLKQSIYVLNISCSSCKPSFSPCLISMKMLHTTSWLQINDDYTCMLLTYAITAWPALSLMCRMLRTWASLEIQCDHMMTDSSAHYDWTWCRKCWVSTIAIFVPSIVGYSLATKSCTMTHSMRLSLFQRIWLKSNQMDAHICKNWTQNWLTIPACFVNLSTQI